MNYFTILNLPPTFEIDISALESSYFSAQRQHHPDRFVGKPDNERMQALQRSADINKAYETLKSPLKRAQYLLHLQGITVGTERDTVKPSQVLLVEIMELNENPPHHLDEMIKKSIAIIADCYKNGAYESVAQEVLRLGYLQKLGSHAGKS